jgi:uncharacterized membrane protein
MHLSIAAHPARVLDRYVIRQRATRNALRGHGHVGKIGGRGMKPLLDALGKAIKALQPVLWFVVVVAAIVSVFLLLYANGISLFGMGCPPAKDSLGICKFITDYQHWIGLIAVISIVMLVMGGALWVLKQLKSALSKRANQAQQ